MEVVSYHNWSDFVYIDSWGFVVGTLKRLTEGAVLQNWPFIYLVTVIIKPAIISEHFREYRCPIRTLGKKTTLFTCAPDSPCCLCTETMKWDRNGAWLTLWRLPIFTECKFRRKKNWVGAKREGQSGFRKQYIFFFCGLIRIESSYQTISGCVC